MFCTQILHLILPIKMEMALWNASFFRSCLLVALEVLIPCSAYLSHVFVMFNRQVGRVKTTACNRCNIHEKLSNAVAMQKLHICFGRKVINMKW